MPAYQGEFDGLCGMYAIANAYELCGCGTGEGEFQTACLALPKKRWPSVLWNGTDLRDMRRMVKACQADWSEVVSVRYPFYRDTPGSNDSYWRRLTRYFEDESTQCAIVRLIKPWDHWVVISPDTRRRMWFTDSSGDQQEYRKNFASLYAGKRRRDRNQWLFDPRALIGFERHSV